MATKSLADQSIKLTRTLWLSVSIMFPLWYIGMRGECKPSAVNTFKKGITSFFGN